MHYGSEGTTGAGKGTRNRVLQDTNTRLAGAEERLNELKKPKVQRAGPAATRHARLDQSVLATTDFCPRDTGDSMGVFQNAIPCVYS
jgi:hypothetical protein